MMPEPAADLLWKPIAQSGRVPLLVVRHGQTQWNAEHRFLGRTDLPLNAVGRAQVAAVGRAEMVKAEWLKPQATVIDVGINRLPPEPGAEKGRLVGDVDYGAAQGVAGAITPVPGGVGPMTIAVLLRNTLVAAYRNEGLDLPEGAL